MSNVRIGYGLGVKNRQGPPVIAGVPVTSGREGEAYAGFSVSASRGVAPYTFALVGTWPGGITITPRIGAPRIADIAGTPNAPGTFTDLSVRVTDAIGATVELPLFAVIVANAIPRDMLLLCAGQSVMQSAGVSGAGSLPVGWANTARVQMWNNATNAFAMYNPAAASLWGPEVAYAKAWLADHAADASTLYIVKLAVGGSQLGAISTYGQLSSSNQDWSQSSNQLFDAMTAEVVPARAALAGPYDIRVLWVGNQSDGQSDAATADLNINLAAHFAAIRAEWAEADTPITFTTIPYNVVYRTDLVVAEERQVLALSPLNRLVDFRYVQLQGDGIHPVSSAINEIGAAAYAIESGPLAPTGFATAGNQVPTDASTGTVVTTFKPVYMDGSQDAVFSLQDASDDFEIVGFQLRVKVGATLTEGSVDLTVRCTGAGGFFEDDVTITTTAAGQWWAPNDLVAVDLEHDRAMLWGVSYASIAAAVTAGVIVGSAPTMYIPILPGNLPAQFSIFTYGVNAATHTAAQYAMSIDDGADGVDTDFLIFMGRDTTPRWSVGVYNSSVAQASILVTGGINDSAVSRQAARLATNNVNFASNGVIGAADTSAVIPSGLTRINIGNNTAGNRPHGGTLRYLRVSSDLWDDATIDAITTPP
jgi:hypothetical protein